MKLFDVGPRAIGVIAVGQEATGFLALGQTATGVIAIGQLARGGIAVGQLAFGLVGWGQGGVGIFHAVGMLGVGGRGFGPVLRLVPSLGRPRELPPATTIAAVAGAGGESGWIEADLTPDLALVQGGARLPIKLDRRLQTGAREITTEGPRRVLACTRRVGPLLICDRIVHSPPRPYQKKGFWLLATFQLIGLLALGTAYAAIVGHELLPALGRIVNDGAAPTVRPPAPAPRPVPRRTR
jgi:hypothetical protein